MFSPPVREIWVQHLTVKLTSSVLPVPWMMRSTGTGCQTGMSPGMRLTRNLLRRPIIERLWEVWEASWTGIRFLSLKLCPLRQTTTPLPVHLFSLPVKSLWNSLWTTGCAGRCPLSTSPSQKGIPPGTPTILASLGISLLNLPDLPNGTGCMLRWAVRVQQYAPGHRTLPNSTIPSPGFTQKPTYCPHPPGPSVKICSGIGREQHGNRQ